MNTQSINSDYQDGSYLEKNPTWHAERSPWKVDQVMKGLRACNLKPQRICDIGGGTGVALDDLVTRLGGVERAVNFEPSTDAPQSTSTGAKLERRFDDVTKAADRFDLAMMLDVFEHVEDYLGFLRGCSHVSQYFAFHIPLDVNVLNVLHNSFRAPRTSVRHLHYFTRYSAIETLKDTNYEILHWHYTARAWEGPERNAWKPVNLLRRTINVLSPELLSRALGGLSLLVIAKSLAFKPSIAESPTHG